MGPGLQSEPTTTIRPSGSNTRARVEDVQLKLGDTITPAEQRVQVTVCLEAEQYPRESEHTAVGKDGHVPEALEPGCVRNPSPPPKVASRSPDEVNLAISACRS